MATKAPFGMVPWRAEHVVRIFGGLVVNIDHNQRHQHIFRINLINAVQSGVKMRRRIHVCTPLTDVTVLVDPKAVLLHGVQSLDPFIRRTLPMRNARCKGVGQVHELMRFDGGQRIAQRIGIPVRRMHGRHDQHRAGAQSPKQSSHGHPPNFQNPIVAV
jgi:hypothetical protein